MYLLFFANLGKQLIIFHPTYSIFKEENLKKPKFIIRFFK